MSEMSQQYLSSSSLSGDPVGGGIGKADDDEATPVGLPRGDCETAERERAAARGGMGPDEAAAREPAGTRSGMTLGGAEAAAVRIEAKGPVIAAVGDAAEGAETGVSGVETESR